MRGDLWLLSSKIVFYCEKLNLCLVCRYGLIHQELAKNPENKDFSVRK